MASATFEVLLLSIAYKFSAKKELSLMALKKDPNFNEKLTFVWKTTWGIWWTLTQVVESLKSCTFMV